MRHHYHFLKAEHGPHCMATSNMALGLVRHNKGRMLQCVWHNVVQIACLQDRHSRMLCHSSSCNNRSDVQNTGGYL